jgi:hypothetical protein
VQACGVEAALNPLLQFVLREMGVFANALCGVLEGATNDDIDGFAGFFVRAKLLPACTKLISCSQRAFQAMLQIRAFGILHLHFGLIAVPFDFALPRGCRRMYWKCALDFVQCAFLAVCRVLKCLSR